METSQTDLLKDFTVVTRTFEQLSQRLTDVAEQVRTSGVPPSESLIDEIVSSRRSFAELRDRAIELVSLLAESPSRTPEEIGSIKDLEALLQLVTEAQRKKAQEEKARLRALTILDRILSLIHREQQDFPPLDDTQTKARALRETLRTYNGPEAHPEVNPLAQGRHPLAELLALVEGYEDLDDDLWLLLKHAVAENFGKSLAISAARGKLCPSPTRLTSDYSPGDQPNGQMATQASAPSTDAEADA
ncbi:MAG: hypothetical protein ACT4O4_06465 [Nitrospiraceae bacterium]